MLTTASRAASKQMLHSKSLSSFLSSPSVAPEPFPLVPPVSFTFDASFVLADMIAIYNVTHTLGICFSVSFQFAIDNYTSAVIKVNNLTWRLTCTSVYKEQGFFSFGLKPDWIVDRLFFFAYKYRLVMHFNNLLSDLQITVTWLT